MQHSLSPHGLGPSWDRFSSRCSRKLRRLRHYTCSGAAGPALAACSSLAAGGSVSVLASAGPKQPEGNDPAASSSSSGGRSRGGSSSSGSRPRGPLEFGSPLRRCTDGLLLLNGALFLLQWASRDALMLWGAKINSLVVAGQWWRLITCSFLHTSALHLAINSYTLNSLGPHVELLSGRARFAAVYLGSSLLGSTASFLMTPAPSVGASAGLFGLGAALGVFYARNADALGRQRSEAVLQQLGLTLLINVAYSAASKRIDNWGHIGGLVGGAALSWLLGPALVKAPDGTTRDQPPLPLLAFKPAQQQPGAADNGSSDNGGSSSSRRRLKPIRPDVS